MIEPYYINPITWNIIPVANNPRIITIGDTFFLSNHIQRRVTNNPAKPGINESKLFCNVVTLTSVNDNPDACCNKASLIPFTPSGSLLQSIYAPSLNLTDDTVGANETDMHYKNVNINKDFTPTEVADIRTIETGDVCPKCGKPIKTAQGIEVGHIFKLGTKYSDALGLKSLDETGKSKTVIMGCYGIGVTRCLAAAIEQNNDENGIIWPVSIAPYHAIVIPVNSKNEEQSEIAEKVYNDLKAKGIEVLLDDRNERAGVKFKDADLIGIPVRIVVGKKCGEGVVEYKERTAENAVEKNIDDAVNDVVEFINNNR